MNTSGRHLLVEYYDCNPEVLNDLQAIEASLIAAAKAANATIVQSIFHRFSPQGVSGVVVIEESHLSIHTWPEAGYAAVDFYTCGDSDPALAHPVLLETLAAKNHEMLVVDRGAMRPRNTLKIAHHYYKGDSPRLAVSGRTE